MEDRNIIQLNNHPHYNAWSNMTSNSCGGVNETFINSEESEVSLEKENDNVSTKLNGQSLCKLEIEEDHKSLISELGSDWLVNVVNYVLTDLNKYGFCAVDKFLGSERAEAILSEVRNLHSQGLLHDGRVVSNEVQAETMRKIRGDKMTWVRGFEPGCEMIHKLILAIDTIVMSANKNEAAGKMEKYCISCRTKAMVACYPGQGTGYVKHIDNPNEDGRCITAIYYINKDWQPQDGGVLRIYPKDMDSNVAEIEPLFDRMLFFWSDRRNPHEVLPSSAIRYAITVWYLDQAERERHQIKQISAV